MLKTEYQELRECGDSFEIFNADCVELSRKIESESIDYSIFSPPFSSLYTYSDSERDMGNSKSDDEFFQHFCFLIEQIYRITKPGRLCSVHCMQLPTVKCRDGYIGIRDFRGEIVRAFLACGWIYHSEVCIWKDPVTAMQRTKALGLLHRQLKKDSCMSRQGIPDYLLTFRKQGENAEPVGHKPDEFPVSRWQKWASPVWMDISQSNTLQKEREEKDEKHICPLQLDVIERGVVLWSNPGDTVFSPFAGIGSEGHCAIQMGRKFVGAELKRSYYEQAAKNLAAAHMHTQDLFSTIE